MKVRDVIALSAANLGREDIVAMANDCASSPKGELSDLLRCYNLVENEVALDYFPLVKEETLPAEGGTVPFSSFSFAPVEILGVSVNGGELSFETRGDALLLPPSVTGAEVKYTYSPAEKEWEGEAECAEKVSARLLSFGVCCEYCLSHGQYGEAAMWEKKFREALRAASGTRRRLSVRSRRWV